MACFVQIFTYTIIYSKIKDKKNKTFPYLPTQKLMNKSETDLFFSRPYGYISLADETVVFYMYDFMCDFMCDFMYCTRATPVFGGKHGKIKASQYTSEQQC